MSPRSTTMLSAVRNADVVERLRLVVQVQHVDAEAAARDLGVVLGVLGDEGGLVVGDERPAPLRLAGREGGGQAGVVVERVVAELADLGLLAPVVLVRHERHGLRRERLERERAGADHVVVGPGHRVLVGPEVLGHDEELVELDLVDVLAGGEVDRDLVAVDADVAVLVGEVDVQLGVVLAELDREGDVVGGEVLAVRPLDAVAGGDDRLRGVVVPLDRLGEPGGGRLRSGRSR